MPAPTAPPRVPLSRDRVLREAVRLADAEGLDAVTMRRLATSLDVVPMALYKHVADKEDLLDGMVDTLIDDFPEAPTHPAELWDDTLRDIALGARRVVTAHAWARRAIESRTRRTVAVLRHMERVSQVFLQAGFTPDLTHHVMHLLGNRIWGFSPELFVPTDDAPQVPAQAPDPNDFPGIIAIAVGAQERRPGAVGCDEDFEFGFALDVLLGGIEQLRRSSWSSPQ